MSSKLKEAIGEAEYNYYLKLGKKMTYQDVKAKELCLNDLFVVLGRTQKVLENIDHDIKTLVNHLLRSKY